MITLQQAQDYVHQIYNEQDSSDRIEDRGFAFYVETQPKEYLETNNQGEMTIGDGPTVILKEDGTVYSFSSNPAHMFGSSELGVGVNNAQTLEEFQQALDGLRVAGDVAANSIDQVK